MSLFASKRERRLWLWTLAVMVAIYSTLGLAGTLTDTLRDRGLFDGLFVVGFLILLAAVLVVGWITRPGIAEIGIILGIAAVYAMVVARMGIPVEERTHLFEYSLIGLLVYQALTERRNEGRPVAAPAAMAVAATAALGWIDEGIQWLLPNRVYDIRDVGFNALAGFIAVAGTMALKRVRRLASRNASL